MVARRKPRGEELEEWSRRWDAADHEGKRALCEEFGITYDTGRHWRSDSNVPKLCTIEHKEYTSELEVGSDTALEILRIPPKVHLDFVSFDIETSNLKADFSIMLTACIKPYGQPAKIFRADDYQEFHDDRTNDRAICKDVAEELAKHAIVITHYGKRFDMCYLRAKMVKHGLSLLPPMFGIDTYQIAKSSFMVSSRRLKALSRYFELGAKTEVEGGLWMDAALNGSTVAIDKIVEHNVQDVIVLERLAAISFPYLRSIPRL